MKIANVPKKMSVVFGVNGQRQELLADAVSGEPNASYNAGFPPITMIAKSAGGQAPLGKDFNQIFNELSADAQWSQASGIYPYDSDFSAAIGGYPKGAVVIGIDGSTIYKSLSDDNTSDPTSSGWSVIASSIDDLPDEIKVNSYGTTLADFASNINYMAGNMLPSYSEWSAGSSSTYNQVWRWKDGSFWFGMSGSLPSSPDPLYMRRYDPFGDSVNIQKILANIFFNNRSTSSTLWSIFLSGVTNRIPISSNTTMFSGSGTMDSVLSIAPMLTLAGLLTWPDYSLSGAPQLSTLSSAAASGYGTYANCWNLSTPAALGVSSDTGVCAVWTGVTRAKRLYRLVITTTGHIFIKVMSADLTWGSSYEIYSTLNTTKASDGTLSAASPIVRIVDSINTSERTDLMEDTFEKAGDYGVANDEASGCIVNKLSTGTYHITGCSSLSVEGWQVKDPFPLQGSTALGIAEGTNNDDGSVTVCLYKRKLTLNSDTMEITESKGELLDVPAESWIDVRLAMPTTEEDQA